MKKLALAATSGVLVLAAAGVAGVAGAQSTWPSVKVTPTVTPNRAGTAHSPQPVKLKTVVHWQTLGAASQPVVTKFLVLFPQGSLYNGAHTARCSAALLNRGGPQACPKASLVGSGTGTAYADTTTTHPQITLVNGGGSTLYFYTVLNNPARVQEPVVGHVSRLHGKWAYALSVTVPQNLRVVAGVPIALTSLSITAGKGRWLETTSCPRGHRWPFSITTSYENPNVAGQTGQSSYSATTPCRS